MYLWEPIEPEFFGPPEREPHGVLNRRRAAHLQRSLEHRSHPRTVVVDAGALRDAVQVRSHHDDVLRGTCLRLCDHVARLHRFDLGVDLDRRRPRPVPQERTVGLGDADHRNLDVGLRAERATHLLLGDVVGDHQPDRATLDRHRLLGRERAGPAVHQDHRAGDRQAVIVGCRAPRRVLGWSRDQRTGDPVRPGAGGILQHMRRDRFAVHRQRYRPGLELPEVEIRRLHVKAFVA